MNTPGTAEGNWHWRFQEKQIDQSAHDRLANLTAVYSRWNGAVPADLDPRFRPTKPGQTKMPAHDDPQAHVAPSGKQPQTAP